MRLKDKTALIAGAGRNNGRAIALKFAQEGADLILIARSKAEELNDVAKQCEAFGVRVLHMLADMSNHVEVNKVVQQGLSHFGKVDVLVSSMGIRNHKRIWEYDYDEWLNVFAVNVHSTFYLAKALAPAMMQRKKGSIIALGGGSSLTALRPSANGSEVAAKHGLYGLIKSLAVDLGPYGIRANHLVLSYITNNRLDPQWYPHLKTEDPQAELLTAPLRRKGTTDDVANAALFLASDESSYITGDRMCCMGGRYM